MQSRAKSLKLIFAAHFYPFFCDVNICPTSPAEKRKQTQRYVGQTLFQPMIGPRGLKLPDKCDNVMLPELEPNPEPKDLQEDKLDPHKEDRRTGHLQRHGD